MGHNAQSEKDELRQEKAMFVMLPPEIGKLQILVIIVVEQIDYIPLIHIGYIDAIGPNGQNNDA
jgi:hypothetical protein